MGALDALPTVGACKAAPPPPSQSDKMTRHSAVCRLQRPRDSRAERELQRGDGESEREGVGGVLEGGRHVVTQSHDRAEFPWRQQQCSTLGCSPARRRAGAEAASGCVASPRLTGDAAAATSAL